MEPAPVAENRLIGHETRALRREGFNNDKVDAREIGAGLQGTAFYEVTPMGSSAILNDALRYAQTPETGASNELGFLHLRYKNPGEATSHLIETPISPNASANPQSQLRRRNRRLFPTFWNTPPTSATGATFRPPRLPPRPKARTLTAIAPKRSP